MTIPELRAALTISYGFRVPASFARLVDLSKTIDLEAALGAFLSIGEEEWLAPAWRDHATPYHTWQPEFFEVLRTGMDGISQGFVVHAPELEREEWPVFEDDPSWSGRPLTFLGETLPVALEMLVAHDEVWEPRDTDLIANADYVSLASAMELSLERKTLFRRTNSDDCFVPDVPPGWRFEKCADMIGVLAPAATFCEEGVQPELSAAVIRARGLLERGFAGSALLLVRNAFHEAGAAEEPKDLLEAWADSYAALGRPLLERVVRKRIRAQEKQRQAEPVILWSSDSAVVWLVDDTKAD